MLACVMATVPANGLIRRRIKSQEDDPRMPAILEDDAWSTWLGEGDATPATAKAVLRTMEGVNWRGAVDSASVEGATGPSKPDCANAVSRNLFDPRPLSVFEDSMTE